MEDRGQGLKFSHNLEDIDSKHKVFLGFGSFSVPSIP